jgi:Lon protease-like protein
VIQSEDLLGDALFKKPFKVDDCGWVSNRLAELLPISLLQKNHLLAQTNPRIRLDLISEIIEDDDLRSLMMH